MLHPRGTQGRPKRAQERPRAPQECPRVPPKRPKRAQESAQERLKSVQEQPRAPQGRPKRTKMQKNMQTSKKKHLIDYKTKVFSLERNEFSARFKGMDG